MQLLYVARGVLKHNHHEKNCLKKVNGMSISVHIQIVAMCSDVRGPTARSPKLQLLFFLSSLFGTHTGFNPEWKETFVFTVMFPEMALLRVRVMDKDLGLNQDDFIGSYTLPVTSIVPGYRHIHLTSGGNMLSCASLFVHVMVQDYVAPNRAVSLL